MSALVDVEEKLIEAEEMKTDESTIHGKVMNKHNGAQFLYKEIVRHPGLVIVQFICYYGVKPEGFTPYCISLRFRPNATAWGWVVVCTKGFGEDHGRNNLDDQFRGRAGAPIYISGRRQKS